VAFKQKEQQKEQKYKTKQNKATDKNKLKRSK
jgi:hypothetical protein